MGEYGGRQNLSYKIECKDPNGVSTYFEVCLSWLKLC
jgi:hypothetical protein